MGSFLESTLILCAVSPGRDRILLHSTFISQIDVVATIIELMSFLNEFHLSWALIAGLKEHQVKETEFA